MARKSSLRAEANTLAANLIFSGIGSLILAAGLAAAVVGPAGLALLLAIPVNVWLGMRILRSRQAVRNRARRLSADGERALCVVRTAVPVEPAQTRGGERLQTITCDLSGGLAVEGHVFWSAAAPGTVGIADRVGDDVHLYFALGPETVEELERALDLETGFATREPRLPDRRL